MLPTRWEICSVISHYVSTAHMHTCFTFWHEADIIVARIALSLDSVRFERFFFLSIYIYIYIAWVSNSFHMNKNEQFCILSRHQTEIMCIAFHLCLWTSFRWKNAASIYMCRSRDDRWLKKKKITNDKHVLYIQISTWFEFQTHSKRCWTYHLTRFVSMK